MSWFIAICVAFVGIFALVIWVEVQNPCLERGPQRLLYMQQVGNVMIPIYTQDCIRREKP